jgi:hypothetical protein
MAMKTLPRGSGQQTAENSAPVVLSSDAALPLPAGAATESTLGDIETSVNDIKAQLTLVVINQLVYDYVGLTTSYTAALTLEDGATTLATKITKILVFDNSGEVIKLAWSATPTILQQIRIPPGGEAFDVEIPAGASIYIATKSGTASGKLVINFLG